MPVSPTQFSDHAIQWVSDTVLPWRWCIECSVKNGRWGYTAGCAVWVKRKGHVICACCKEFKKAGRRYPMTAAGLCVDCVL